MKERERAKKDRPEPELEGPGFRGGRAGEAGEYRCIERDRTHSTAERPTVRADFTSEEVGALGRVHQERSLEANCFNEP